MRTYFTFLLLLFFVGQTTWVSAQKTGEVTRDEAEEWVATVEDTQVYKGNDMIHAIQAAINNLTAGRTVKETVNVRVGGSTGTHSWDGSVKSINMASYTILDFHENTMHVNDHAENNIIVPIRSRGATHFEVRNMKITGNPRYGIWIFGSSNVILDNIHISIPEAFNVGLGIRFEDLNGTWNSNVTLDNIYVEHSKHHAVEFWRTNGLTIGTITTENTGGCGLLLNNTRNATVQLVDAYRANHGGGYAGMRFANNCGPDVLVEKVIARDCGRGMFSVSGTHGITVNEVDISGSTNQGILIEDTQNFSLNGGVVKNSSSQGIRITSRSSTEHHATSNVTIQNVRVYDDRNPKVQGYAIQETLPRTNHNFILNNDLRDGGGIADLSYEGTGTVAEGNILTGMDPSTNVNKVIMAEKWSVHPNPNNGQFQIHMPEWPQNIPVTIEVLDLKGRVVYSERVPNDGSVDVNLSARAGMYVLRLSAGKKSLTKKLMIL